MGKCFFFAYVLDNEYYIRTYKPAGSITFALKFGAGSIRGRVLLVGGLYFNATNF